MSAWPVPFPPVACKRLLTVSSRGGKRGLRSLPLLVRVPVPTRGVGLSDHIEAQHLPNAPNPNSTRLGAGVSTHEFGVHELVHSSSLLMWGGSEQLGLNERVAGSSRKCRRLLGLPLGPRLAAVPPGLSREHGDGLWPGVLVSPPVASLGTPVSSSPRPCPRLGAS